MWVCAGAYQPDCPPPFISHFLVTFAFFFLQFSFPEFSPRVLFHCSLIFCPGSSSRLWSSSLIKPSAHLWLDSLFVNVFQLSSRTICIRALAHSLSFYFPLSPFLFSAACSPPLSSLPLDQSSPPLFSLSPPPPLDATLNYLLVKDRRMRRGRSTNTWESESAFTWRETERGRIQFLPLVHSVTNSAHHYVLT